MKLERLSLVYEHTTTPDLHRKYKHIHNRTYTLTFYDKTKRIQNRNGLDTVDRTIETATHIHKP